jgi:uncharacterized protein YcbX
MWAPSQFDYQLPDPITDPDGYEITRPDLPKLVQKRTFYVTADVVFEVSAADEAEARRIATARLPIFDTIDIKHVCED